MLLLIIIAIYSNFAFAREPFKYRGVKIFDAFQNEKKYTAIFSNHSSNDGKNTCQPRYNYRCPGTDLCYEVECGEICGHYCCEPDYTCCEQVCCLPGNPCIENLYCCPPGYCSMTVSATTLMSTPTQMLLTEEPEEPDVLEPSISCSLTTKKIKDTTYRKTAKNADPGTFAYEYNSEMEK